MIPPARAKVYPERKKKQVFHHIKAFIMTGTLNSEKTPVLKKKKRCKSQVELLQISFKNC